MKFLVLLLLSSCITLSTQAPQKLNPNVYYRHDLCFTYESGEEVEEKIKGFFKRFKKGKYRKTQMVAKKVSFCGVGVLPYLDKYRISIKAKGELNAFSMRSCHEEATTENPSRGIWKVKDTITINYIPTLEKNEACPLAVSAYNRKQKHATGLIVFEHPDYQLNATLHCNGFVIQTHGVSICHSRQGLIQKLTFPEPVMAGDPVKGQVDRRLTSPDCPPLELSEDKMSTKIFKLPNRECMYPFIGIASGKEHQFHSSGYESIILNY